MILTTEQVAEARLERREFAKTIPLALLLGTAMYFTGHWVSGYVLSSTTLPVWFLDDHVGPSNAFALILFIPTLALLFVSAVAAISNVAGILKHNRDIGRYVRAERRLAALEMRIKALGL